MGIFGELKKACFELVSGGPRITVKGEVAYDTDTDLIKYSDGAALKEIVEKSANQILQNKTIDADQNTVSNISNSNVKAGAGIEYSKLNVADGDLTIAKTNGLQTALDSRATTTELTSHLNLNSAHGVSGNILGTSDIQNVSNKTHTNSKFDDFVEAKEVITPSNPATGYQRIYPKSDGKWYYLNSAGVEQEVGSGSGSGGSLNWSGNPYFADGLSNVTTTDNANFSITRSTAASELQFPSLSNGVLKVSKASSNESSEYVNISDNGLLGDMLTNQTAAVAKVHVDTKQDLNYVHGSYHIEVVDQNGVSIVRGGVVPIEADTNKVYSVLINPQDVTEIHIRIVCDDTNSIAYTVLIGSTFIGLLEQVSSGEFAPVGSIHEFGGADEPENYLMCDGRALDRTTYAELFGAIGTAYGNGDGSTTFNIPDLRGKFVRGTDDMGTAAGAAGNDPDSAGRTSSNSGNTGNSVGSEQADGFKAHTHASNANGTTADSSTTWISSGGSAGSTSAQVTGSTGGNETRPLNVYTNFIIKYRTGGNNLSNFELGLKTKVIMATATGSTSNASFADANTEIVDYDSVTGDIYGNVTTGTGWRYTSDQAENVLIIPNANWGTTLSLAYATMVIYKNNAVYAEIDRNNGISLSGSAAVSMKAGDYIDVRLFQDHSSGGARSLNLGANEANVTILAVPDLTIYNAIADNEDRELHLDQGNGFGSTNTRVRRFSNVNKNTLGSWATYTDSTTLGSYITFHKACKVYVNTWDRRSSGGAINIVLNGTDGTANSPTYAQGQRGFSDLVANISDDASAQLNVKAGDVLWIQNYQNTGYASAISASGLTLNIVSSSH